MYAIHRNGIKTNRVGVMCCCRRTGEINVAISPVCIDIKLEEKLYYIRDVTICNYQGGRVDLLSSDSNVLYTLRSSPTRELHQINVIGH